MNDVCGAAFRGSLYVQEKRSHQVVENIRSEGRLGPKRSHQVTESKGVIKKPYAQALQITINFSK
jgi:hypothetical protein